MESSTAPPPLEDLLDGYIDGMRDLENGPSVSVGELEEALGRRIELAGGPGSDVDKLVRAGAALSRLGTFAKRVGALQRDATVGDEDVDLNPDNFRDGVARTLAFAIHDAGEYAELTVLERATAIRELTEAYVRLGGELRIAAPRPALEPERSNEELVAGLWRRLNEAGHYGTALIDEVVGHLRAELEAGQ